MTPPGFFQSAKVGYRIRYGAPTSPPVEVTLISRDGMYAWGSEEGTNRKIFLFLRGGLLCDQQRGDFNILELLSK